jgi:cell division septal protein FtsQ
MASKMMMPKNVYFFLLKTGQRKRNTHRRCENGDGNKRETKMRQKNNKKMHFSFLLPLVLLLANIIIAILKTIPTPNFPKSQICWRRCCKI